MENSNPKLHFAKQALVVHKDSKSHEKFMLDIYLAVARQYSNNLSEETKKGLYEKAAQGWYPGNQKRGYKTIGELGHKTWVIDHNSPDSKFIPVAFELYDTGNYTLRTLCEEMFRQGWVSSVGKAISTSEMHIILSDCFYCGEFVWRDCHYRNGKHQPLISKELYYRVQERLTRKITGKFRKHEFLFGNGLLICGECGYSITAEVQKGHSYYHCTRHNKKCTQRRFIREERLEEQIVSILEGFVIKNEKILEWVKKALKEAHRGESDYHITTLKDLDDQLLKIERRLSRIYDDYIDEVINKDFYETKKQQLEEEQQSILLAKENHIKANIDYMQLGINIFELSQMGKDLYQNYATREEKRELLNFVFSNFKLRDEKLIPTYQNGFQLLASRPKDEDWLRD